jgi:hypothetical protein
MFYVSQMGLLTRQVCISTLGRLPLGFGKPNDGTSYFHVPVNTYKFVIPLLSFQGTPSFNGAILCDGKGDYELTGQESQPQIACFVKSASLSPIADPSVFFWGQSF